MSFFPNEFLNLNFFEIEVDAFTGAGYAPLGAILQDTGGAITASSTEIILPAGRSYFIKSNVVFTAPNTTFIQGAISFRDASGVDISNQASGYVLSRISTISGNFLAGDTFAMILDPISETSVRLYLSIATMTVQKDSATTYRPNSTISILYT
jgi:hypothetical protein